MLIHALELNSALVYRDAADAEIFTLSLHDALPISGRWSRMTITDSIRSVTGRVDPEVRVLFDHANLGVDPTGDAPDAIRDRKSTRLNSSHVESADGDVCLTKTRY